MAMEWNDHDGEHIGLYQEFFLLGKKFTGKETKFFFVYFQETANEKKN